MWFRQLFPLVSLINVYQFVRELFVNDLKYRLKIIYRIIMFPGTRGEV